MRYLTTYEAKCGTMEIRVIAITRNEPQEWEKLQWDKYEQFWGRFHLYELPEPEDHAMVGLLRDTIPKTQISAQEEDYPMIAGRNDCTFRNVVENLSRLENRGLSLTQDNYRDTLRANWEKRYEEVEQKYPVALYIYQAVDLLRRCDIMIERFTVEPTAKLIIGGSFWQQFWWKRQISPVLDYLVSSEGILQPRDGQIEALGNNSVQLEDYWESLFRLVLRLTKEQKEKMIFSIFNFGNVIHELEHYIEAVVGKWDEAIASYEKAIQFKPDDHPAWYNKAICYSEKNEIDLAIESWEQAINLNPQYRERAKTNPSFDKMKSDRRFERLIQAPQINVEVE